MSTPLQAASVERFSRAAPRERSAMDARDHTPRCVGADSNQRWKDLRGHLKDTGRLDVLVRGAAVSREQDAL